MYLSDSDVTSSRELRREIMYSKNGKREYKKFKEERDQHYIDRFLDKCTFKDGFYLSTPATYFQMWGNLTPYEELPCFEEFSKAPTSKLARVFIDLLAPYVLSDSATRILNFAMGEVKDCEPYIGYNYNTKDDRHLYAAHFSNRLYYTTFVSPRQEILDLLFEYCPVPTQFKNLIDQIRDAWDNRDTTDHKQLYIDLLKACNCDIPIKEAVSIMVYTMYKDADTGIFPIVCMLFKTDMFNSRAIMSYIIPDYGSNEVIVDRFDTLTDEEYDNLALNVQILLENSVALTHPDDFQFNNFQEEKLVDRMCTDTVKLSIELSDDSQTAENYLNNILIFIVRDIRKNLIRKFIKNCPYGDDKESICDTLIDVMLKKINTSVATLYALPEVDRVTPGEMLIPPLIDGYPQKLAETPEIKETIWRVVEEYYTGKIYSVITKKIDKDITRHAFYSELLPYSEYDLGAIESRIISLEYGLLYNDLRKQIFKTLDQTMSETQHIFAEQNQQLVSDKNSLLQEKEDLLKQLEEKEQQIQGLREKIDQISNNQDKKLIKQVKKVQADNIRLQQTIEKQKESLSKNYQHINYLEAQNNKLYDNLIALDDDNTTSENEAVDLTNLHIMLVHERISQYWPNTYQDFPNALFYESDNQKITSGTKPDYIVFAIKFIAHSTYRKVMSWAEDSDIPVLYYTGNSYSKFKNFVSTSVQKL